jgi:hypothetical protein
MRSKTMRVALLATLLPLVPVDAALAKFEANAPYLGKWSKVGTADTISLDESGDLTVFLSGQASPFSGQGSTQTCTDAGANLCLIGARFRCAFRYSIVQGILNLQFRTGGPDTPCKALSGEFRKIDEGK